MKKSILSVVLLLTMIVSIIAPVGVFAAPTDVLKTVLDNNGLSGIIDGLDNVYGTADDKDKIIVPANIQLKQSGGTYGNSNLLNIPAPSTDPATFPTFDFQATLGMGPVRQAFTDYINGAKFIIDACAENATHKQNLLDELKTVPVTGRFIVTIQYTDGLVVPDSFKTGTNMSGFKINGATYSESGNVYKESTTATRSHSDGAWDTLTITVDVKGTNGGNLTAGDLMTDTGYDVDAAKVNQYFADLALECTGVKPGAVGTLYEVKGIVTGNTKIGGNTALSAADAASDNTKIANIIYNADQVGTDATQILVDLRQVSLYYNSGGSGSSGVGSKYVVVKFDVDGDTTEIDALKLKVGTTVDFDTIEAPVKEGHVFDGFYYDEECTKKITGEVKITKNTVVYARWIAQGDVSVVVDVNGKTDVAGPFIVQAGETINFDELAYPTMAGYVFDGFYLDKDFKTKASGEMVITEDMLLYGRWLKTEAPDVLNSEEHLAYIAGYPNLEIRPFNNISREEVATIFYRILKKEKQQEFYAATNSFTDVEDDRWSNEAISTIANGGYIIGYEDGTFRPEDYITRAEFVTIVARFHDMLSTRGTPYHDIAGHWGENYIITAAEQGWVEGYADGTFRPDEYITRADVIQIINRLLVRCVNKEGLHADTRQWIDNYEDSEYYYDILEATNSHDYERQADNYNETWSAILKENLIIDELFYEN